MNAMRVGLMIGAALALQACAAGGPAREAPQSEADKLILGVMTPEEMSCPTHMTKFCTGSSRLSMQCSCQHPQAVASSFGYYW